MEREKGEYPRDLFEAEDQSLWAKSRLTKTISGIANSLDELSQLNWDFNAILRGIFQK